MLLCVGLAGQGCTPTGGQPRTPTSGRETVLLKQLSDPLPYRARALVPLPPLPLPRWGAAGWSCSAQPLARPDLYAQAQSGKAEEGVVDLQSKLAEAEAKDRQWEASTAALQATYDEKAPSRFPSEVTRQCWLWVVEYCTFLLASCFPPGVQPGAPLVVVQEAQPSACSL